MSETKQFRGVFIPAAIVFMVEEGKLSASEAWLLAMIDAYTVYGEGCWASNAFFAKRMGVSSRTITEYVANLLNLGLLLEDGWKDTPNGRFRKLEARYPRRRKKEGGVEESARGGVEESARGGVEDSSTIIIKKRKNKKGATATASATLSGILENGNGKSSPKPEGLALAKKLREGMRAAHRLFGDARFSAAQLDKIGGHHFDELAKKIDDGMPYVAEVLDFLLANAPKGSEFHAKLPAISSAAQFVARFQWIADEMEKRTVVEKIRVGTKQIKLGPNRFRDEPIYKFNRVRKDI